MPGAVALRPVEEGDEPFLLRVYAGTRAEELARVPWDDAAKAAFVRMQFRAQTAWYREHYPGATHDVVLVDDAPAGRLYVHRAGGDIRIVDIALLPEHRGRGTGTELLRRLLAEADAAGARLSIHVERFNPALRLYERHGFALAEDKGVHLLLERPPAR